MTTDSIWLLITIGLCMVVVAGSIMMGVFRDEPEDDEHGDL